MPDSIGETTFLEAADEIQLAAGEPLQQSESETLDGNIIELVETAAAPAGAREFFGARSLHCLLTNLSKRAKPL